MQKILAKKDLNKFLGSLIEKYELVAPVKEENTKFKIIKDPKDVYLDFLTLVPVKKSFIPEHEEIFSYKNGKIIVKDNRIKPRVIFGLRKCDINALQVLDRVMPDPMFIDKRKNSILIGLYCDKPDKYCFCESMELNEEGYDLFFYPFNKDYYISVGTKRGEDLVKNLPKAKKELILKYKNYKSLKDKDIERNYKNKIWESDSDKCLSCSACTIYCPTCNCFDIKDKLDINLKDGVRTRHEMSCQLKSFSRVAGGKSYRDSRLSRFKHFVYHKIVYYKKRYNRYMCVGCGRCLRVCPTKIDWVETINILKSIERKK
ncbi:MAG: 4Fe-4S dicluster domain-containing protein [Candidatus Pacearchaeota archaeon]|jgi:sulfhydrogenase subunit beta (sulfur reductase)